MSDATPLDFSSLEGWVGPTEISKDTITERLVNQFRATLGRHAAPTEGDIAPPGIQWCLAPSSPTPDQLGVDGVLKRGAFLPPVTLPRSMWAGGRTAFHQPLRLGDAVTKISRVIEITPKSGASGSLVFISINHRFMTERGLAIEEWQNIVYREAMDRSAARMKDNSPAPLPSEAVHRENVAVDSVLLFRFAALTFNSHRIHYDLDYARDVEGYPGLVVQGALQAALILNLASRLNPKACPREVTYRAVAALFGDRTFRLCAAESSAAQKFWVEDSDNRKTFSAAATW